jgi:hypothetical protein
VRRSKPEAQRTDSRREQSPEDGLLGPSRGLITSKEDRVQPSALLAWLGSDEQRQEGSGRLERAPDRREDQGPEGRNPRSGLVGNDGKARRGARRQEGSNPEDARCQRVEPLGVPAPSCSRPLKGPKPHERDSAAEAGRVRTARGAGVVSGNALKESESPRVDRPRVFERGAGRGG